MLHTDEQLMLSVKDGNRDAFRILTDRHYTNTLNFIYRFVKNRTVAEDLCQETFLRVWRCVPTYRPIAKFRTFLYHIAKNVCLKQLAKDQRTPQIESLDAPYSDEDENSHPHCGCYRRDQLLSRGVAYRQGDLRGNSGCNQQTVARTPISVSVDRSSRIVLPGSCRDRSMSDWYRCLTQKRCDSTTPEIFGTLQDQLMIYRFLGLNI